MDVKYRPSCATDLGYVIDTWAKSFFGAPAVRVSASTAMAADNYFRPMHSLIVRVLARPRTRLVVACDPKDEDLIVGWACIEDNVCHFVFVRKGFEDVVSVPSLYGEGIKYYSHRTSRFNPDPAWEYCPFFAWNDPG